VAVQQIRHSYFSRGIKKGKVILPNRITNMYMDDAIRGTIELMDAPADKSPSALYNFMA
jgi:hypothetical protein